MKYKKPKSMKYEAHGSGKFSEGEIKQGFKVCYDASDLRKMDDQMNAHMKKNKMMMEY